MAKLFKSTVLAVLLSLLTSVAHAQATTSIHGRVVEMRGYIMHGLIVTARNNATGREYQAISDDNGFFNFESLEPGKTTEVELLALPVQSSGNDAVDKFIASSEAHGGSYPAGNISYLNVSDSLDMYLMWVYFGILILLSVYGIYRYRLVYLFL